MKKSFRQFTNDYFSFMRNDRIGIIVLSVIMLVIIMAHVIIGRLDLIPDTDFSEIKQSIEVWKSQNHGVRNRVLFEFDPNTVSGEKLDCLDIPGFIGKNILAYRAAGGKYRSPSDMRKIYGMNDSLFNVLYPFIRIENERVMSAASITGDTFISAENLIGFMDTSRLRRKIQLPKYNPLVDLSKIDLNSADSAGLTRLYGIGPVFASRIVKYRKLLGGYYSPDQLLEVYGLGEETYMLVKEFVVADTSGIKQLRINFDGYRDLIRHPYLNNQQVDNILNYRSNKGPFISVEQILRHELLDSASYNRIKPYLTCR